ncbi:DNA mismatch repair protein, partial [Porphyromonas gingivalis]
MTVLGEAISNAWDADAHNVYITVDREKNTLIIKDDGKGMTDKDFQNKFLKIGYSKRKDNVTKTLSGRPFIGRKGIGKLALLSCAKRITVLTKTEKTDWVGGIIDNSGLDEAIKDDISTNEYKLSVPNVSIFEEFGKGTSSGTIIIFEEIN